MRCTFSFKVYFFFVIQFTNTLWAIGLWCNEFYTSTTLTCSFSPSLPLSNFTFLRPAHQHVHYYIVYYMYLTIFVVSRALSFLIFTLACSSCSLHFPSYGSVLPTSFMSTSNTLFHVRFWVLLSSNCVTLFYTDLFVSIPLQFSKMFVSYGSVQRVFHLDYFYLLLFLSSFWLLLLLWRA